MKRPLVRVKLGKSGGVVLVIMLLVVSLFLGSIILRSGDFLDPGEDPEVPAAPRGLNATCTIVNTKGFDITMLTEVRLWVTYNTSDPAAWSWVDVSRNYTATDFWDPVGWLNGYFFNWNLSDLDAGNRTLKYYVEVRAWHQLAEWMCGTYIPPSWWIGSAINMPDEAAAILQFLEEGETAITWQRIYNGPNLIKLYTEPDTNYLAITHQETLKSWQVADGSYPDGAVGTYHIRITTPSNESERGYNQEYDWTSQSWAGLWLIASSESQENIYSTYQGYYGNDCLKWFNVTDGLLYRGVLFDDSITPSAAYDCAMLLPTFSGELEFYANIAIKNGSSGIQFFLGRGTESNIEVIMQL